MLEWIIIAGALVVFMSRVAEAENQSGLLWGLLTFALCIVSAVLVPSWPFVSVLIAGAVAFGAMFAYKVIRNR